MAAPYTAQKDHLDYAKIGDTGQDNVDAIAPISDGEPATQSTFRRPSENLRERTEDVRQAVEDLFYYRDAQHLAIASTGTFTWEGTVADAGTGKIVQTAPLVIKPFLTPRADTKASISIGVATSNEITYTVNTTAFATNRMNQVFIEHRDDGVATPLSVSISDNPIKRIVVHFDSSNILHDAASVKSAVDAAIAADLDLLGKLVTSINAAPVITVASFAETRFEGTADAEEHVISSGVLDALTTTTPLQAGDTVAVWYRYLIDPAGGFDGRRESLGAHGNTNIPLAALFVTSDEPDKIPGAIPLCTVSGNTGNPGTTLIFIDGTVFNKGDTLKLGGSSAVDSFYSGGPNWADATTNPSNTVEGQLDKIVSDLASGAGTAKINGNALAATPPGNDAVGGGTLAAQLQVLLDLINDRADLLETTPQTFTNAIKAQSNTNAIPAIEGLSTVADAHGVQGTGAGIGSGVLGIGGVTDGPGVGGFGGGPNGPGVKGIGTLSGSGDGVQGTGTGNYSGGYFEGGPTDGRGDLAGGGVTLIDSGVGNGTFQGPITPRFISVGLALTLADVNRVIRATSGPYIGYSFIITNIVNPTTADIFPPPPANSAGNSWTLWTPGGAGVRGVAGQLLGTPLGNSQGVEGVGGGLSAGVSGLGGESGGPGVAGVGGGVFGGAGVSGVGGAGLVPLLNIPADGVRGLGGSGSTGGVGVSGIGGGTDGTGVSGAGTGSGLGVLGIGGSAGVAAFPFGFGGYFEAGNTDHTSGSLSIAADGTGYGAGGIGGGGATVYTSAANAGTVDIFGTFTYVPGAPGPFTAGMVNTHLIECTEVGNPYRRIHFLILGFTNSATVSVFPGATSVPPGNFSFSIIELGGPGVQGIGGTPNGPGVRGFGGGSGAGVEGTGGNKRAPGIRGIAGSNGGAGVEGVGLGNLADQVHPRDFAGIIGLQSSGLYGVYGEVGSLADSTYAGIAGYGSPYGFLLAGGYGGVFLGSSTRANLYLQAQPTPTNAQNGDIYLDSADGKLYLRRLGVWREIDLV